MIVFCVVALIEFEILILVFSSISENFKPFTYYNMSSDERLKQITADLNFDDLNVQIIC